MWTTIARQFDLEHATPNERPSKSHLVGVLQIAARGKPACGAGNRYAERRQQSMQIRRCSLSRQIEIRGHDHLLGAFALHTLNQFANLELIGSDAFDRGHGPMQDVVAPFELAGALEGEDVQRFFDHANRLFSIRIDAYRTWVRFGRVETHRTQAHALLDIQDRFGQRNSLVSWSAK